MKITIDHVGKTYKSKKKQTKALSDVSFEVDSGEIVCILGHNGAGKTTLIKSICGLLLPDAGEVRLDDTVVARNLGFAHEHCGAVLEGSRNIYHYLTGYENLRYFSLLNKVDRRQSEQMIDHYLELFELSEFRNVPAGSYSRGMQQKLAIIVALMKQPQILLLDEPTLGLDMISADSVIRILKSMAGQMSVIVTTHDVNLIEQLDSRLIFMNHGQVIRDTSLGEMGNDGQRSVVDIYKEVMADAE